MERRILLKAAAAANLALLVPGCRVSPVTARGRHEEQMRRLVEWMVRDVHRNVARHGVSLVSALPSGRTRAGKDRADLENLYWLQNNNLYAMHALRPHAPEVARDIEAAYHRFYRADFPGVIERTEHYYTVGQRVDPMPPRGRYFQLDILRREHEGYVIGTEVSALDRLGRIQDNEPRGLLKFGVLGEVLRGDREYARQYFDRAMALWDGNGFMHTRWDRHGSYYGRYLAFALIADNALGRPMPFARREQIEARLWSIQDPDGGFWTNYHADGSYPSLAKKTMEIAPLALLACADG
jgi:hypothetical protein